MTAYTVIWESDAHGHRLYFVKVAAKFSERPVILLTANDVVQTQEFAAHFPEPTRLQVRTIGPKPTLSDALTVFMTIKTNHPDSRFLCLDSDRWLSSLRIRHLPLFPDLSLLIMREPSIADAASQLARRNISACIRTVLKVGTVRLLLLGGARLFALQPLGRPSRQPTRLACGRAIDPTPSGIDLRKIRNSLRTGLNIKESDRLVTIAGGVHMRKNPKLLLEAVQHLEQTTSDNWKLLLAGNFGDDTRVWLAGLSILERRLVTVLDRYMSDHDLDGIMCASDVISVLHDNDGPSGILKRAAALRLRTIVSGGPVLRVESSMIANSRYLERLSVDAVATAIKHILQAHSPTIEPTVSTEHEFTASLLNA